MDYDLKKRYGEKAYRIALDGGMTCPNRDGTIGSGGCIFCSANGSGDFAGSASCSVSEQLAHGKQLLKSKRPVHAYIAYFQAFTNTYAPVEYLEKIYMQAVSDPDVRILSIATRRTVWMRIFLLYWSGSTGSNRSGLSLDCRPSMPILPLISAEVMNFLFLNGQ